MYSQTDEEEVILRHFNGRTDGRLLDCGAFDGTSFSNSRALIELGWHAVLAEPSPWPFAAMTKLYWNNERVTLINAAVAAAVPDDGRLMKFLATEDAISCHEENTATIWGREKFRTIYVRPVAVDKLPPGSYDFVTIDVEDGTMPLVLSLIEKTMVLQGASLICLEHTAGGVSCRKEMLEAMKALGKTVVHETRENYLFT